MRAVHAAGLANLDNGLRLQPDTVFGIGPGSEPLTGAALERLSRDEDFNAIGPPGGRVSCGALPHLIFGHATSA